MRENFNSKFGFILAAAGSAIGLGNIYQFPFKAGEGGGAAFLFLYLLFTFVFCLPVMISEIAIGRAARQNAAGSYRVLGHKRWSLLGKTGVLTGFVIFSYYIMIAGWILSYLFDYLTGTPAISQRFPELVANPLRVFGFAALFMAITVLFIARGVRGIESAVRLLMPALTILLLGLVIYALTLDGASQGLAFYLQPSADEFLKTSTIHSALSQAFFSLSLGMGALITYGSYMKSNQSIVKSAALIAIADVTIAFLAGLLIFPVVFSFGMSPSGGPEMLFATLPKAFESMGSIGPFIGFSFFLLLSVAVLTSTISFLEVITAYVSEEWQKKRQSAAIGVGVAVLLLSVLAILSFDPKSTLSSGFLPYPSGISVNYFTFIDDLFSGIYLPLGGLLIILFASYRWKNFKTELATGDDGTLKKISWLLDPMLRYICPIILALLVVISFFDKYFGIHLI